MPVLVLISVPMPFHRIVALTPNRCESHCDNAVSLTPNRGESHATNADNTLPESLITLAVNVPEPAAGPARNEPMRTEANPKRAENEVSRADARRTRAHTLNL